VAPSAPEKRHDKSDQAQEKEQLSYPRGCSGDSGKPENPGDYSQYQKNNGPNPTNHSLSPLLPAKHRDNRRHRICKQLL